MGAVGVPQDLDLDDVVAWGLTAIDLLVVVAGLALGWWLDLRIAGPITAQLAVGAPPGLLGLALGILRIGGRPLRTWLLIALGYAIRPHVLVA